MRAWLFKGSARNVAKSILQYLTDGVLVWGLHGGYRDVYGSLGVGDRVYLYAIGPVKAVVARGVLVEKFVDDTVFWPEDSGLGDRWPYRFRVDVDWCGVPKEALELLKKCIAEGVECDVLRDYGVRLEEIKQRVPGDVIKRVFGRGSLVELSSSPELQHVAEVVDSLIEEKPGRRKAGRRRGYVSDRLLAPTIEFEKYFNLGGREETILYIYGKVLILLAGLDTKIIRRNSVEEVVKSVLGSKVLESLRFDQVVSIIYNDLRRLCVISTGGGGDWRKDTEAILTSVGVQVSSCVHSLHRITDMDQPEIVEFIGSLPIIFCSSRCYRECVEEEAGVCSKLCKGEVNDNATLRLVAKAVEIAKKNIRLLVSCLSYGVDATVVKELKPKPLVIRKTVADAWSKLTLDKLKQVLEEKALVFDDHVLVSLIASLRSHRHVLLMGPPGTGKSKLVNTVAEVVGYEVYSCTANSSWTRYDFIGGPVLGKNGKLVWKSGHLLKALARHIAREKGVGWILLVEELNRAEADKVLAEFFTMFPSSDPSEWIIPYSLVDEIKKYFDPEESDRETQILVKAIDDETLEERRGGYGIPSDFRVFTTINTFDRAYLFTLGYALQRRFTVIEVNPPTSLDVEKEAVIKQLELQGINRDKIEKIVSEITSIVHEVRKITGRLIGTSIIIEASKIAYNIIMSASIDAREAVEYALRITMLSQLEGLEEEKIMELGKTLKDKGYKHLADAVMGLKIV